ncbi:serine hydrolase domain-containing protein [Shimia sagamensis]|uniref:CubicO group peptidase, beta-lactamase class C family n=1 Tax=Shimia sagamensis TaxID=1566352 RepID=A0ABY1P8I3_9RHOB|nr:serine hydrolase [Shimia sagamensis]SMP27694.1 CubicO group peptidase, beta-lactamase class C family [Shimia sagamensis]
MTHPLFLTLAAALLAAAGYFAFGYAWPKMTLFDPDHRVERFRSLSDAFPTVPIARASKPAAYDVAITPIAETYVFEGKARNLSEFLARSETTAFLVVHRGDLVHEAYFQGNSESDLVTSFSVAKSFVSTLVGIAVHDGLIDDIHEPITKYVPALAGSGFDGVAISDVLTMSSGIAFSEVYDDKSTDAFTIYDKMFLKFRSVERVMGNYGSLGAAGQEFQYASLNTQALGQLIKSVSGMSVASYMQQTLWHPLAAEAEASWSTDLYGNVLSFWGLNATARDFARFGVLFAQGGQYQGQQVVPADWVSEATTASAPRLARGNVDTHWGYGYQWWLPDGRQDDFSAIGIWGQFIYVSPNTDTVIVKMSADPDFKSHEVEAMAAFRAIAEGLNKVP